MLICIDFGDRDEEESVLDLMSKGPESVEVRHGQNLSRKSRNRNSHPSPQVLQVCKLLKSRQYFPIVSQFFLLPGPLGTFKCIGCVSRISNVPSVLGS